MWMCLAAKMLWRRLYHSRPLKANNPLVFFRYSTDHAIDYRRQFCSEAESQMT
uniref:Uncharacterized protein n=1 Tax=Heterorhabditis bacteriophora TaxID=37862 RepID=A0A1I7W7V4_HETBA